MVVYVAQLLYEDFALFSACFIARVIALIISSNIFIGIIIDSANNVIIALIILYIVRPQNAYLPKL